MKALASLRTLAALGAAASLWSCGGTPGARHPDGALAAGDPAAAIALPASPLRLPLAIIRARGVVRVKIGDDPTWRPLVAGTPMSAVREVEVTRQGAVLAIGAGDAAGRLWLRAGARLRLAQDDQGVYIAAIAGRSRLHRSPAALPVSVATRDGAIAITGDVLLAPRADGTTEVLATGARPELADWSLALERDEEGAGIGRLEAKADGDVREPLALRRVDVRVTTAGDQALTEVEHVFFNPAAANREGTFRFPVPDGAVLTGLAMEINGHMMEGEIVEREKARETYDKIVDEMQDPALLEWEHGNWFKLRVFPIEASQEKRVVIRYTTPLVRGPDGWTYDFTAGLPDTDGTAGAVAIGALTVTVDGKLAAQETDVVGGLDLSVPVAATLPAVTRQTTALATYTAVRITPDTALFASATPMAPAARRMVVVFDTSRSTLESRPLAMELLRTTLGELAPEDRFVVLASDVAVTPHSADLVAATPAAIAAATAFLDGIEPDGASDLGAALTAAAALAPTEVVYVGDGVPTWGELGKAPLAAQAARAGAPIHAALLGKGASTELWADLAGASGGRAMVVRRSMDADRFALGAAHLGAARRLRNVRVALPAGAAGVLYPGTATTLWEGDTLIALVRTAKGEPVPTALTLTADVAGKPVAQQVSLAGAVDTKAVAQRWAVQHLAMLEASGAPREEIVKVSQDHGVMSRYTSLLVLESEEAYKAHEIERKKTEEQLALAGPTVTGGDLDSLGAREASLSPDEVQPGDPEIKIPAPADARSVVVTFPWGESKVAVWDRDVDAWMVRFLIDLDTPDGDYLARVAITHADGRVESLQLGYTVDTTAPAVRLTVKRTATGYVITARQIASGGSRRKDADRVEVLLPDGTLLRLTQVSWGKFEGEWVTAPMTAPTTLRVVVRDHALNQAAQELVIP